jgi:hypothetical protein
MAMIDQDIINHFYKNDKRKSRVAELSDEMLAYLNGRYADSESINETVYRIFNHIDERPVCPMCGGKLKFVKSFNSFCSKSCSAKHSAIEYEKKHGVKSSLLLNRDKVKQTMIEKYGVDNYAKTKEFVGKMKETCQERYGVESFTQTASYREKTKQTCIEKYGVEHHLKSQDTREKIKSTINEKFGCDNAFQNKDIIEDIKQKRKQTCIERYGTETWQQSEEHKQRVHQIKQKEYDTRKANNTWTTSSIEERIADWLESEHVDFERQYRSDAYPFACDFWLKDYDLYIEIQGTWTHGGRPYNSFSIIDSNIVQQWRKKQSDYYDNAIYTWTKLDPKKRKMAKENGVNLLEIFSQDFDVCVSAIRERIASVQTDKEQENTSK